ncbi:MAG: PAS domain S-box protein [Anaerolineaceae bacterium]|nr:PAS domain S-box protein [Anaerolineaceae bacterium]MCB9098292.1 PAS domain S-box protein [Anaerolineales bacterium]
MAVIIENVNEPQVQSASLCHIEVDQAGTPAWMQIVATWEQPGQAGVAGYRMQLNDSSIEALWLAQPERPLIISNTATDDRLDENTRHSTSQYGVVAIVSMPLRVADQWVGLLTLNWSSPQTFDPSSEYLYGAIGMQVGAIVHNWQLLKQIQTEAQQLAQTNITLEHKVDEHKTALIRTEKRFQAMVEKSTDLFGTISAEGIVQYISPSITAILGYKTDDILNRSIYDFVHPDDMSSFREEMDRLPADPHAVFETEFRAKAAYGNWVYLELRCRSLLHLPEIKGIICNARDVTERKLSENMNRELNRRLMALQAASATLTASLDMSQILAVLAREMVYLLDMQGCAIHEWLPEARAIIVKACYSVDEQFIVAPLGTSYELSDYPVTEKVLLKGHIEQLRVSQEGIDPSELAYMQSTRLKTQIMMPIRVKEQIIGLIEVWDTRIERVLSEEELELAQLLGRHAAIAVENARLFEQAQQEIVNHQQTETALRASEARNKALLNANPDIMIRRRGDGTFIDVRVPNPADLFLPAAELLNRKAIDLPETVPLGIKDLMIQATKSALRTGQMQIFEYQVALHGIARDFEARTVPSGYDETISIIRDITERKKLEAQLRQSHKMEAIGQLAAGIAHDFNNILTSILGYAELLRSDPSISPTAEQDLERIIRQGQRAAHLIRQILDFARKSEIQKQPIALNEQIDETVTKLLKRTLPEDISLTLDLAAEACWVMADPDQIQQILINLALNARDAMPQGGDLCFRLTRLTLARDDLLPFSEMEPGGWLKLTVADTGEGILPDNLPYIFDPFFTTKEVGRGTGLGLAQVFGIVKNHKGQIGVESKVAEGTTFTIYLPAAPEASY